MKIEFSLDQINAVTKEHLLPLIKPGTIFLVKGHLGAGKTTLAKVLAKSLGVFDELTSPTFAYVNIYKNLKNAYGIETFLHFDLYRLESFADFINLDLLNLINQPKNFCFIEWPELILKNSEYFLSTQKIWLLELEHVLSEQKTRILSIKLL